VEFLLIIRPSSPAALRLTYGAGNRDQGLSLNISFENCNLNVERRELMRDSQPVVIGPKVFDLLVYLMENRDRVLGHDELLDAVWAGRIISPSTLASHISAVRRAIGDTGQEQRLIRTVARRGFRFIAEIQQQETVAGRQRPNSFFEGAGQGGALTTQGKPSIAVLPFQNLSDDPEQEYFADGIVEDITTRLSKFRNLFVIARNSSFQYKGKAVDARQVGRELGVRHLLEGSVRRVEGRVRISAQLIDAESGAHLWAEKYDRTGNDLFELQDEVTNNVVGAIQPAMLLSEGRRAVRKDPINMDAFDCCMRGIWHAHQSSNEDQRAAEYWLRRSVEMDDGFGRAHYWLARLLFGRCWAGISRNISRDLEESRYLVERALAVDGQDAEAYHGLAILELLAHRHERALRAAQRAIELNENFHPGFFALGETRIFMGDFAGGLEPIGHCLRLSPTDPFSPIFVSLLALAHYHLGNYDEALRCSEEALRRGRAYVVLRTVAATLGQLGRRDEASTVLAEMERSRPMNLEAHWRLTCPYACVAEEAKFVEGLRKAGCNFPR
jgi:adenylate cyclase